MFKNEEITKLDYIHKNKHKRNFLIQFENYNKYIFTSESDSPMRPTRKLEDTYRFKNINNDENVNYFNQKKIILSENHYDNLKIKIKNEKKQILTKFYNKKELTDFEIKDNSSFNQTGYRIDAKEIVSPNPNTISKLKDNISFKDENLKSGYQDNFHNERNQEKNENLSKNNRYILNVDSSNSKNDYETVEKDDYFMEGHELLIKNISEKNYKKENEAQAVMNTKIEEDEINKILEDNHLKTKINKINNFQEDDFLYNEKDTKKFKNLNNSSIGKNSKKFSVGILNRGVYKTEPSFCPVITCQNYLINNNTKSKFNKIDLNRIYNTNEKNDDSHTNKYQEYYFTNFFLSSRLKKEFDKNKNFDINIDKNLNNNTNEDIKNKEMSKIRFSYFSEFASLKHVDSLRIRKDYNKNIKSYKSDNHTNNNLEKQKLFPQREQSKIIASNIASKITNKKYQNNYYNFKNIKSLLANDIPKTDFFPQESNNNNSPRTFDHNHMKKNKLKIHLPKLTNNYYHHYKLQNEEK